MDPLSGVLAGAAARAGTFTRSVLDPPWGLRFLQAQPLSLVVVLRGHAWLFPEGRPPTALAAGDAALTAWAGPYDLTDSPRTDPGAVVYGPGRVAAAGESESSAGDRWRLHGRTYGEPDASHTVILHSGYDPGDGVAARVLAGLPPVVPVRSGSLPAAALALLTAEIDVERPGQEAILHRLLDLLTGYVLRSWFDSPAAPAWYTAMRDPAIGPALRRIHDEPGRRWTVAALAAEAGMSRAAFARRFRQSTGEPPLGYLTRWRMAVAADLLRETNSTLDVIARKVGYSDGFAFSAAFKKYREISPAEFRREST